MTSNSRPSTSAPGGPEEIDAIAMLVYPGMTILDMIGPQFCFAAMSRSRVHIVGKTLEPITSDSGIIITPTTRFADCPKDLAVLFVGGGGEGTLAAMQDPEVRAFVADRGADARYVTSVCTGALILGAAGLLQGYRATTHWGAFDLLAAFGAIPTQGRVVRDRNRFTGGGITAGIDFGLTMVAEMRGATEAQTIQLIGEYDPAPPFDAGSPATVRQDILDAVTELQQPLCDRIEAFARTL